MMLFHPKNWILFDIPIYCDNYKYWQGGNDVIQQNKIYNNFVQNPS